MMQSVSEICQGSLEAKGSKFFSFLIPFSRFDTCLQDLRVKHPKAVHFVYATRVQDLQIMESFSDDGEPRGSSGVPTLNVLRGENLIDVGLVTVRYFGGTLLGVGGLVRAYTQAAQEAIKEAKRCAALCNFEQKLLYPLRLPYTLLSQAQYFFEKLGIDVVEKHFDTDAVALQLRSTLEKKQELDAILRLKFDFY